MVLSSILFILSCSADSFAGYTEKKPIPDGYVGSENCAECHPAEFEEWRSSVHSGAERMLAPDQDDPAFVPEHRFESGSRPVRMFKDREGYAIETLGPDSKAHLYRPDWVIGVTPLWQYVIPDEDGRYQVTSLAYDAGKDEWFDVFGNENRRPDEWGFWANRGMTWNTMCAGCHNTAFRKNYDVSNDRYTSEMVERGVGCEACHGPGKKHVDLRKQKHFWFWWWNEDPIRNPKGRALVDSCGVCHSRRTQLTEDFVPGDRFLDHYIPHLPDFSDTYYPDGQVRDEDYVYSSFLMSRMYEQGVHCLDCHQAHTAKIHVRTNKLCLRCHEGKIDPALHGHHRLDRKGSLCVECHMPVTVYMQRQPRHDHSMSIPDPDLTIEYGVPNACNRCHQDKSLQWASEWVNKWYPPPRRRYTGWRARVIAAARRRVEPSVVKDLSRIALEDPSPTWRAVAAQFLSRWLQFPEVQRNLGKLARAPDPLVRTFAVGALETLGEGDSQVFSSFLKDPVRSVRVRAAWAVRKEIQRQDPVLSELEKSLFLNADQVAGALQLAVYLQDRGKTMQALSFLERAARWDKYSPLVWESLAVALRDSGRMDEAIIRLREGCRNLPQDAHLHQSLGLLEAERGDLESAIASLRRACKLDPSLSRAWYNLGLALHQTGRSAEAVDALSRALSSDPTNPDYPFALAALMRDLGRFGESEEYARSALSIDPGYRQARELLSWLESRNK